MPEWDVSLVTDMQGLFRDCPGGDRLVRRRRGTTTSAFNQRIWLAWDTARVTT
jgi:hypothetical protein